MSQQKRNFVVILVLKNNAGFAGDEIFVTLRHHLIPGASPKDQSIKIPEGRQQEEDVSSVQDFLIREDMVFPDTWKPVKCDILWYSDTLKDALDKKDILRSKDEVSVNLEKNGRFCKESVICDQTIQTPLPNNKTNSICTQSLTLSSNEANNPNATHPAKYPIHGNPKDGTIVEPGTAHSVNSFCSNEGVQLAPATLGDFDRLVQSQNNSSVLESNRNHVQNLVPSVPVPGHEIPTEQLTALSSDKERAVITDIIEDSSDNESCESSKIDLSFSIKIDGERWKKIKPVNVQEKHRTVKRLQKPWTQYVRSQIWTTQKLPCAFSFKKNYFHKSADKPYFTFVGQCKDKRCRAQLKAISQDFDSKAATIQIKIINFRQNPHSKKAPLNGEARCVAKNDLKSETPIAYQHHVANELIDDSDSGDNCPLVSSRNVLAKAKQEIRDEKYNIKQYGSAAITALMELMHSMPVTAEISSIPFMLWWLSKNQKKVWNKVASRHGQVFIDATGLKIIPFEIAEEIKCSNPFLYVISTHIGDEVYSVGQALSEAHDSGSIGLWLLWWIESVDYVLPQEVVADCSGAILNAICYACNGCTYNEYLNRSTSVILKKSTNVPPTLVKRDRNHLVALICRWKPFEGDNWTKKDFYVRCMAFSLEIDDWEMMEMLMESVFIVTQSQTCDPDSICWTRTKWLKEKIATFDVKQVYGIDTTSRESSASEIDYQYMEENFDDLSADPVSIVRGIYNSSLAKCQGVKGEANQYYLPKLSKNLIAFFNHFPANSNLMNKYYKNASMHPSSAKGETFFRIIKRDYGLNHPMAVQRFVARYCDEIDGATKLAKCALKKLM